jgi:hypothetical protein
MSDIPFQLIMRCSNHERLPRERVLFRPTEASAIEGVRRWLRLYRRTDPAHRCYDQWAVYDLTFGRVRRRLVKEGTADEQQSQASRGGVFRDQPHQGG